MPSLKIRLLGHLEVVNGAPLKIRFPTRKSRELFAFLAFHGDRRHPRELLASTFWGEGSQEGARKCLRTELWRLKGALEAQIGPMRWLAADQDRVGLHRDAGVWVDAAELETRLMPLVRPGSARLSEVGPGLREVIELYRGDLLEGHYEEWCLEQRERLKVLYLSALEKLIEVHEERREWEAAVFYGRRLLAKDPLAEHVHRGLMRSFFAMGRRTDALRQYQACVQALDRDLGVEPMPETVCLWREIRRPR